ncbi:MULTISPECIES: response regulator [Lysinibacillus]|uniref:Response regulator n=1 Tax=Lysinibacillus antri TaxID=2498145 RepID=A0A432LC51_9BACI|nr:MULTISPECIES: response regulator [Lysinibacillus]RUL53150.1 response regulator [Lysinibacillus antri]TSI07450.1 response regulator [Lysinibacillus sp. BW-2-10]
MRNILIVDDQRGIRLLLEEVLLKEGYHVDQASNGIEALKILEVQEIDCVLLDLKIPGMNGLEILKKIREMNLTIPVFMMTALDGQEVKEQAKDLEIENCFTKPFNIFDIIHEVNRVLKK